MSIKTVGIVGCGQMGRGIAEVASRAGYEVVVREVTQELLDKGLSALRSSLERAVAKGKMEEGDLEPALARLSGGVELEVLAECDLVVEAIIENVDEKKTLFRALDQSVKKDALFASNTSSLTLTQLAVVTSRPESFLGLHFFNPVPVMQLVEVVRTILTSDETFDQGFAFIESLGKTPVACKDNSGFIVNRLLVPYLLDAIRAYENGVGSLEDIDRGMRLGCGHPMGPFVLLDFIGLDTILFVGEVMFEEYRETRFAPPPLLKQMVQAGRLGRKSGRGFYSYED